MKSLNKILVVLLASLPIAGIKRQSDNSSNGSGNLLIFQDEDLVAEISRQTGLTSHESEHLLKSLNREQKEILYKSLKEKPFRLSSSKMLPIMEV
ncbi:MAG TPA: hypothetical protein DCL41_02805 [Bdellovibrionales bacterium]|nr:hypothetical protein [Pseudobdellovibrionaceae bacterium]HAG90771.1 hypothetical protein [Bdellovibrionales bacterium]